jgi:adenylate cyclase
MELLRATGHAADRPWAPIGIGVNAGVAFVGAVGTADHVEFTALGDVVNVTARLASAAEAGALLVTTAAAEPGPAMGGLSVEGAQPRHLDLRGKASGTDVLVLTLGSAAAGR